MKKRTPRATPLPALVFPPGQTLAPTARPVATVAPTVAPSASPSNGIGSTGPTDAPAVPALIVVAPPAPGIPSLPTTSTHDLDGVPTWVFVLSFLALALLAPRIRGRA